jgi:hypothetical protein
MKRIAWQTITLTLVLAGTALASTSGTPLDTVSTQVMTLVSGPIGLLPALPEPELSTSRDATSK